VLRITATFAAGLQSQLLFRICHVYLGQVLMVLVVCAVCLAWQAARQPKRHRERRGAFLARLVGFSGILFLPWLALNVSYVRLLDGALRLIFARFGYTLAIPYRHDIYFQSFNLVALAALVLAARASIRRKVALLAGGLLTCAALQLAFRSCDVLITSFHSPAVGRISLFICLIAEYLVPAFCWLLLSRQGAEAQPAPIASAGQF